MAGAAVKVSLIGDASSLQRAFRDTEGQASTWGQSMGRAGSALTVGLTAPIVAGATLAIKAGAEEQQQMEVLADVIRRQIPGATDAAIAANEDWISSIQNTTGMADSELRGMEQKFLAAGASIEDAQKMTAAALDTSIATGKDYNSIADAMVKGMAGQTAGFGRLGINVKNADGSAKSLDQIMEDLAVHTGAAAGAADNAAGRAEIQKLKMADLAENVGMILLPVLDKLSEWLGKITDWFTNLSPAGQKTIVMILGVAAAVGPVLIVASKLVTAFGVVGKAFKALSLLMATNPWLLLIAAVVALVVLIVANWDKIKAYLDKVWKWIKSTAGAVWDWVKSAFQKGVDFIKNLFLNFTPMGLIIKHFDKIKALATGVKDWIVDKFNGVVDFFKKMPERISSAVSGLWDGLKKAFRNAINWVIDKWNGFRLQIKLPSLLGGGTIGIDTPNIPRFHSFGTFRAGIPGGEGLALLRDGERVTSGADNRSATPANIYLTIHAGMGADGSQVGRKIVEALNEYARTNGSPLLNVRTA